MVEVHFNRNPVIDLETNAPLKVIFTVNVPCSE